MLEDIIQTMILHDTRSIKRMHKRFQDIRKGKNVSGAEIEAFLLEMANFKYSTEKQIQMQAMYTREMEELAKEQTERENEINVAKLEIERLKIALKEALENQRQKLEYDVIAKQIVKLASRKKTQSLIDSQGQEISKLEEELTSLDQKIEFRKSQLYSLIAHIHEIQASITSNQSTDEMMITDCDVDGEAAADEEGEINEDERLSSTLASLASSSTTIIKNKNPKTIPPNKELVFGKTFTDHMLTIEWNAKLGWNKPAIAPYGKLSLEPSSTVFHYGTECFEGMKAYKDKNGKIRLFRPDMNMSRFLKSCKRLMLPEFDKSELLECIIKFVKQDERWIPSERGYSLYIRPTAIATQESLGVGASDKSLIFVIASPVGPYYKTGFSAVSLYASTNYVRAWPGGTGDAKIGGNYAPGILPQLEVAKDGFQQILWLFGPKLNVTEVGTMNFFMLWINEKGEKELVTPPLDGTILPGVTRDSILALTKEWGEFDVNEAPITMSDIVNASKENRIVEMFGAGTAAIVSPIKRIHFDGTDIHIPLDPSKPDSQAGPLTQKLADHIMGIQYGEIPHKWSVLVD